MFFGPKDWRSISRATKSKAVAGITAGATVALLATVMVQANAATGNQTSINDDKFTYAGQWYVGGGSDKFQSDDHWSKQTNASATLEFTGTKVDLYGAKVIDHGYGTISIDGKIATTDLNYDTRGARQDNILMWSSPVLAAGQHTLKISVTGKRDQASISSGINIDRVVVSSDGESGTPMPSSSTTSKPSTTTTTAAPTTVPPTTVTTATSTTVTSTTAKPTTTTSTTTKPTTTEGGAAGTWLSGASYGDQGTAFGNWRGSPITIYGVWADSGSAQGSPGLGMPGGYTGSVDLAPGMIESGESLSAAATGAYDARWKGAMDKVASQWGSAKTIYIRPAHEMNGNWYPWSVNSGNAADFKKAWIRYYNIIQSELVAKGHDAKVVFSMNHDPVNGLAIDTFWPGDQYVDVVGTDMYDVYPTVDNDSQWNSALNLSKSGQPAGVGAFLAYAKAHGKPLAFPEWGLSNQGTDDSVYFIQKMNAFFRANAGSGPGQVVYEVYFNANDFNGSIQLNPVKNAPKASAAYKALSWGK